ncbi:MAG: HAMP domain-containing histidine kinase [Archangium sp.]|nr:HAMP domain-containing histidine kinase [Archangium sp.]
MNLRVPPQAAAPLTRWLVGFRLAIFFSALLVVGAVFALSSIALPWALLVGLLAYGAASNVALQRLTHALSPRVTAGVLGHDVVLLTALLLVSGGVHNPFSALFLVYIALGAMLLTGPLTMGLVALATVCFAALFAVPGGITLEGHVPLDHVTQMQLHMRGMWVAFAVAAALIGVLVRRLRESLARQTEALTAAQARQARVDTLGAVATLAASATHELGTPLATIAVVAKELERGLEHQALRADAVLIREQVARCRHILERLAHDAGALRSGAIERTSISALVHEATQGFVDVSALVAASLETRTLIVPSSALTMALRSLVKNATDASLGAPTRVHVTVESQADDVCFVIRDEGAGMPPVVLEHAAEPFFSTKSSGLGLGLYLARATAEQLNGALELSSTPGRGTTATIRLPAAVLEPA